MTDDTPISEIDRTYRACIEAEALHKNDSRWPYMAEGRRFYNAHCQAQERAQQAFAALNGWKADGRGYFHPDAIGRRNRQFLDNEYALGLPEREHLFDHCINFRANGKNAAIVTQPYHCADPDACQRWAAKRGLAIHLPPDQLASIHYPGATYFIVITRIGATVKWLPDQDGRLTARWAARKAQAA